jgi:hypothetical protein
LIKASTVGVDEGGSSAANYARSPDEHGSIGAEVLRPDF